MTARIPILAVVGTRPDAIKMFSVIAALRGREEVFAVTVCSTGQHRDLLDQVFRELDYQPDIDLGLMEAELPLADVAARIITSISDVIENIKPALVIVQGDTLTALGAAMAAHCAGIPIVHVEAGLRTYDNRAPFPEEGNRRAISAVASLHLAPTQSARQNLIREGIPERSVHVTGNTGIDALEWALQRLPPDAPMLSPCVLITAHRRENIPRLPELVRGLAAVAPRYPNIQFLWPVHPNPAIEGQIATADLPANIRIVQPLPYLECVRVLTAASFVVTDSGGLQEEAAHIGKRVVILKEKTSRVDLVEHGFGRIVPYATGAIAAALLDFLEDDEHPGIQRTGIYGDGNAAARIVEIIERTF